MADTPRTRLAILNLLADNVTGNISPQDHRDAIVTMMQEEHVSPGDFWNHPLTDFLVTDKTVRGWTIISQVMLSACSFGNILYLTESNTWGTADVDDSARNPVTGVATNSYAAAESQAIILKEGLVYNSALSARFSGFIGRPLYLQSALDGSMSVTIGTSELVIGVVEADGVGSTVSSKWRFRPDWAIKGV